MKNVTLLALALLVAACAKTEQTQNPPPANATPAVSANASRAAELFTRYGCTGCHIIPGVDGPGVNLGPPLDGWANKPTILAKFPNTPENMNVWLQNPQAVDPQTSMPNVGVTPEDAAVMTGYLFSLR